MLALHLIPTQVDPQTVQRLWRDLVREERDRADRFLKPSDRARYVVTRSTLRTRLAECIDRPADQVTIRIATGGKPVLAAPQDTLHFNVSHAGDWAMIAIANYAVGIDIEQRREIDTTAFGHPFFSIFESEFIRTAADTRAAFFDLWVAKEAWLKATGQGLSGLHAAPDMAGLLQGSSVPQAHTHWIPVDGDVDRPTQHLSWLAVATGYHAAISVITPVAPPVIEIKD